MSARHACLVALYMLLYKGYGYCGSFVGPILHYSNSKPGLHSLKVEIPMSL